MNIIETIRIVPGDSITWSNLIKCCFDDDKITNVMITWYNGATSSIEISSIEYENNVYRNKQIATALAVITKEFDINNIQCVITPLNKYLVIWETCGKTIYYCDIFNSKLLNKF